MGVPLNLKDIQSGFLTASAHTANNTLIEEALDKALDRTGATNNTMQVDLDMGLRNINNVRTAELDHQAIPFRQAANLIVASGDTVTSTAERDVFISNAGQTEFTLSNIQYIQGTNSLIVFINGVYQIAGTDYTETTTTSITFNSALQAGDIVVVIGARFNAEVFVTESQGFASAADTSASKAADSATEAENWANRPEDSLVPEGDGVDDYSALHWAKKAEGFKDTAETAAGYQLDINNQSGTSYTLQLADQGDLIRMTNAAANTVIVPTNATVAFPVGTVVNVRQSGTGTTTISPATGVTINAPQDEFTTDGEEFGVAIVKVATDEWDLVKSYAGVRNDQFDSSITAGTGESGYQKLPTGLILQWGSATTTSGSDLIVTFPIAFTQSAINLSATPIGDNETIRASIIDVTSFNTSSFNAATNSNSSTGFYWFALGV